MRITTKKTAKLNSLIFVLGTTLLISTSHAKDITIQVASPSYIDGTVIFPVHGDAINSLTHTFSQEGKKFDKACVFYGAVNADGHLHTQVTLDLTGCLGVLDASALGSVHTLILGQAVTGIGAFK